MALKPFDLASLLELEGGRLALAIREKLREAEADCRDRPALTRPRRVTIHIELTPAAVGDNGALEDVALKPRVELKLPPTGGKVYRMAAAADGLLLNDLSPQNPRQGTLDDAAPASKGPRKTA